MFVSPLVLLDTNCSGFCSAHQQSNSLSMNTVSVTWLNSLSKEVHHVFTAFSSLWLERAQYLVTTSPDSSIIIFCDPSLVKYFILFFHKHKKSVKTR